MSSNCPSKIEIQYKCTAPNHPYSPQPSYKRRYKSQVRVLSADLYWKYIRVASMQVIRRISKNAPNRTDELQYKILGACSPLTYVLCEFAIIKTIELIKQSQWQSISSGKDEGSRFLGVPGGLRPRKVRYITEPGSGRPAQSLMTQET
jgi:hypothetical protein